VGDSTLLAGRTFRTMFTTRFDTPEFIYQLELLGVRSLAIAAATAVFVGIVMTIQFAVSMEAFGAKDTLGRVIGVSEARELAPSLTALVVGSRIAAGIAAELGSMTVTEQVDAIRALGADPIRKLVVPRLVACIFIMPLITFIAFILGMISSMLVAALSYGIPMEFFFSTALDSLKINDQRCLEDAVLWLPDRPSRVLLRLADPRRHRRRRPVDHPGGRSRLDQHFDGRRAPHADFREPRHSLRRIRSKWGRRTS
jgi:phospholipid/cholesterol/gamma-HCH transport system permease protein